MKLIDYITSKNETWYTVSKKLTNGKDDMNKMKQKILRYLKNDDITLSQYQLFADALEIPLKELLNDLGRLN